MGLERSGYLTRVICSCYHRNMTMNRNEAAAALQHGFDPYAAHPDTSGLFSSIGHAISSAAHSVANTTKRIGHDITHPKDLAKDAWSGTKSVGKFAVHNALPVVQTVLKNVGPLGMVASGAIGAMKAGLSGKNLESIAWAAAEGAAPSGIDKAIGAAHAIRNGSNVLKTAIGAAASSFTPGTVEHLGFNSAISALKETGSKVALGVARRALPNEGARRAFDAAVGTVADVVSKNPQALLKRAGSIAEFSLSRPRGVISPHQPNLKHAIETLKRNPTLTTQHPMVLANRFGTSQQVVLQALKHVAPMRLMPWRSLTPTAARFIKKWHPHAPVSALTHGSGNTAGLDEAGTHYIVTKGDSPWAIAQKLSGNGDNWRLLIPLNKDKKPGVDKTVWVGEVLNIPAAWQKPGATAPSPGPATSSQPAPVRVTTTPKIFSTRSVAPSILQAKSILVAWSKTDGVNQAGLPDYGSTAADLSTDFGARDSFVLTSFQNWDNKTAGTHLLVDGILGPDSLTALQQWAERRAAAAVKNPSAVTIPVTPSVMTLPELVVSAAAPPKFVPALPAAAAASVPAAVAAALPTASPTVINTTATPVAATPPIASPTQPATPASVAATTGQSGSKMAPMLAGAAVGGVTFGLPGAIIGAVAGAAIG